MEILIPLLVVLAVGAVVVPLIARRSARDVRRTDVDAVTHHGPVPSPGDPAPTVGGRPVPGSGPDRARHGKP